MYAWAFSIVVSQVKTDSQAPQNVLQYFLEVLKRVPHMCLQTCHWLWLHTTTSVFPFFHASFASTAHKSLENFIEAKHQSPWHGHYLQSF